MRASYVRDAPLTMRQIVALALDHFEQAVELVVARKRDAQVALALAVGHGHARAELAGQALLEVARIRGLWWRRLARVRLSAGATLRLAHAPALVDGLGRELGHRFVVAGREQRAAMTFAQVAGFDLVHHADRQLEQAERVRDRRAVLADQLTDRVDRVLVLVDQTLVRARRLERVEILADEVLDQRSLEGFDLRQLAHEHRHFVQTRALRCAPAPLAGDDLEALGPRGPGRSLADQDRLEHAELAQRGGQLIEPLLFEARARLVAARLEIL